MAIAEWPTATALRTIARRDRSLKSLQFGFEKLVGDDQPTDNLVVNAMHRGGKVIMSLISPYS